MRIEHFSNETYRITLEAGEALIISQENGNLPEVERFETYIEVREASK